LSSSPASGAVFYYDLMSPYAYLTAERIDDALPRPAVWQPVLLGGIFKHTGRSSWALGDEQRRAGGIAEIERRAAAYGLPPLRWPDRWPTSSLHAMRLAVHARRSGREREFAAAAFRTAFAEGRDLGEVENVLAAAERAGLEDAQAALADEAVKDELRSATDAAAARGVFGVPTVAVGDELFWGDDRLEEAGAALARAAPSR
jgi:2-hydroxychromene-2-carboxylate isomerase